VHACTYVSVCSDVCSCVYAWVHMRVSGGKGAGDNAMLADTCLGNHGKEELLLLGLLLMPCPVCSSGWPCGFPPGMEMAASQPEPDWL
jgi:hypothetical protein